MSTLSTDNGYWESAPMTIRCMADREVWIYQYEGWYDTIVDVFGGHQIGESTGFNEEKLSIYQNAYILTNVSINRKVGGLADCRWEITILYKREIWNIDMAEVSKDIKVWLVNQYTTWNSTSYSVDPQAWLDLAYIARWENQRDIKSWPRWQNFQFDESDDADNPSIVTLTGYALELAKKMMKGVTSYKIFTPVITRTTVRAFAPLVGSVGYRVAPQNLAYESSAGWTGFNGQSLTSDWYNLANIYLKTAERSSSNGDGSFTLVEQWTGADDLDPDLYP